MKQFPQPLRVADMNRLVEPVVLANLFDGVFRQFDGHPSTAACSAFASHRTHAHSHNLPFDGTTRNEMHDQEHSHRDPEKRRDNEEQPPEKIRAHLVAAPTVSTAVFVSCFAYSCQDLSSSGPISILIDGSVIAPR